jgi:hypothetical protein
MFILKNPKIRRALFSKKQHSKKFPYVRANTVFLRYESKNVSMIRKPCLILSHFSRAQLMLPVGTVGTKWEGRI